SGESRRTVAPLCLGRAAGRGRAPLSRRTAGAGVARPARLPARPFRSSSRDARRRRRARARGRRRVEADAARASLLRLAAALPARLNVPGLAPAGELLPGRQLD